MVWCHHWKTNVWKWLDYSMVRCCLFGGFCIDLYVLQMFSSKGNLVAKDKGMMMMQSFTIDSWILIISSVVLIFLLFKYLNWERNRPVYISFLVISGLANNFLSTALVLGGYFEFPYRPFPSFTLSNIVYDFVLLPAFELLIIRWASDWKRPWTMMGIFVAWTVVQDHFISVYTSMLLMKKWTLIHSAISSALAFWGAYALISWLSRNFVSTAETHP